MSFHENPNTHAFNLSRARARDDYRPACANVGDVFGVLRVRFVARTDNTVTWLENRIGNIWQPFDVATGPGGAAAAISPSYNNYFLNGKPGQTWRVDFRMDSFYPLLRGPSDPNNEPLFYSLELNSNWLFLNLYQSNANGVGRSVVVPNGSRSAKRALYFNGVNYYLAKDQSPFTQTSDPSNNPVPDVQPWPFAGRIYENGYFSVPLVQPSSVNSTARWDMTSLISGYQRTFYLLPERRFCNVSFYPHLLFSGVHGADYGATGNPGAWGSFQIPTGAPLVEYGNLGYSAVTVWEMVFTFRRMKLYVIFYPLTFTNVTSGGMITGRTVAFKNITQVDGVGTVTWEWDFGDGGTSTQQNPSHTYTSNGEFTVTLRATAETGDVFMHSAKLEIKVPLAAAFTWALVSGTTYAFTDKSSGWPVAWAWSFSGISLFGGGRIGLGFSTQRNPTFNFAGVGGGQKFALLRVTNSAGETSEIEHQIT